MLPFSHENQANTTEAFKTSLNHFTPVFLKWTLPRLNMSIDANMGFSLK